MLVIVRLETMIVVKKSSVIDLGRLTELIILLRGHILRSFRISRNGTGHMLLVVPVRKRRINEKKCPDKHDEAEDRICDEVHLL